MRTMIALLTLAASLALSGCGVTLGPVVERQTVWARMGTPGRIVDQREVEVLVPDGQGGWQNSRARLAGMCVLDEPTLEYYRGLDQKP
jgi:predicted lipoprotein